mmetsp:Transcript_48036/g.128819  ORF Transcript_48036/g.128819 Transcript_48036/m.128819 type:complete len:328 (+) Transcript_48036:527-1510(+)
MRTTWGRMADRSRIAGRSWGRRCARSGSKMYPVSRSFGSTCCRSLSASSPPAPAPPSASAGPRALSGRSRPWPRSIRPCRARPSASCRSRPSRCTAPTPRRPGRPLSAPPPPWRPCRTPRGRRRRRRRCRSLLAGRCRPSCRRGLHRSWLCRPPLVAPPASASARRALGALLPGPWRLPPPPQLRPGPRSGRSLRSFGRSRCRRRRFSCRCATSGRRRLGAGGPRRRWSAHAAALLGRASPPGRPSRPEPPPPTRHQAAAPSAPTRRRRRPPRRSRCRRAGGGRRGRGRGRARSCRSGRRRTSCGGPRHPLTRRRPSRPHPCRLWGR